MVNRNKFDDIIESMKKIGKNHPKCKIDEIIENIVDVRDQFDIKLMIVGHFNAGKSSLLNALIEKKDFLKEAQEPQTAIATELIFDNDEAAFAYDVNGKKEKIVIGKNYTTDKYNHLEYRLSVPALKEVSDFTLVDTPGFDAGIEAHAKALVNYIGMGSAYLVVVDQEKGGIDEVTLDFIKEISNYSDQITVLINKCDKITDEVAESIVDSARFTLASYGLPYKVYTTSKRERDVSKKLVSIISEFDAQGAFDKVIKKRLINELENVEKILNLTKKKLFLDTFDLDEKINSYKKAEEQLAYSFKKKREEAQDSLESTVENVTSAIRSALISRSDSISEALLSGNQVAAEAIIVETIRPIMLSSMKDISFRQIDNVADAIDFSGLISEEDSAALSDIAVNLATSLKDLIEQGTFASKSVTKIEESDKKKNIYRTLTGLAAIATDFIAPWLEVVIILLPDIISLLRGVFGESDIELAKRRFINNVVPQIINKIYPQVKQNVEQTTNQVIDEYEKLLNEKIDALKNNIIDAETKKREKTEWFESYKTMITEDISSVCETLQELEAL